MPKIPQEVFASHRRDDLTLDGPRGGTCRPASRPWIHPDESDQPGRKVGLVGRPGIPTRRSYTLAWSGQNKAGMGGDNSKRAPARLFVPGGISRKHYGPMRVFMARKTPHRFPHDSGSRIYQGAAPFVGRGEKAVRDTGNGPLTGATSRPPGTGIHVSKFCSSVWPRLEGCQLAVDVVTLGGAAATIGAFEHPAHAHRPWRVFQVSGSHRPDRSRPPPRRAGVYGPGPVAGRSRPAHA